MSEGHPPPQDTYARLLMQNDPSRGYPLYIPEPDASLPVNYRAHGIRIGDVGIITMAGGFDFIFNMCLPADHEFNQVNGVPPTFSQVNLCVGEDERHKDVLVIPDADPEGQLVSTCSTNQIRLGGTIGVYHPAPMPTTLGADLQFSSSKAEGAILVLPDGAEMHDLKKGLLALEEEAASKAASWYSFVTSGLGKVVNNDSLYVITGYHKASGWCLASSHQDAGSAGLSLTLSVQPLAAGVSAAYSWGVTSSATGRLGPQARGGLQYDKTRRNQTVSIRGFKVAIRESFLALFRREKVQVISGSPSRINLSKASTWKTAKSLSHKTITVKPSDVSVVHVPGLVSKVRIHPSDTINKFLLDKFPTADVAIIHDSQWMDLLTQSSGSEQELIKRVCEKFTPVFKTIGGETYLCLRNTVEYCKPANGISGLGGIPEVDGKPGLQHHDHDEGMQKSTFRTILAAVSKFLKHHHAQNNRSRQTAATEGKSSDA